MANLKKLIDLELLQYFLGQIKTKFVRSINNSKPDSNGNVNIANMTGASTSAAGKAGLAPAPAAGAANRYLRSDGTWQIPPDNDTKYSNMTGATASAAGKAGLVPAPAAGKQNKFLCADATWKDAGLPVGHEFFTTNPNIPAGCIPLLGGEYSRTTYADLWAWVQTQAGYLLEESAWQAKAAANGGNVPFYSKGDGSTTFRVPALKCWVKGANSISEVGGYLAAGLPNIEGTLYPDGQATNSEGYAHPSWQKGCFKGRQNVDAFFNNGSKNSGAAEITFSASLSNPIYGSSDTVQPPSIVGLWVVKAYGSVTNVGSTDVANIAQGLTNAETRISVLNTLVGAENNGGIVDALLEQNGYVKFANGLILQWGTDIGNKLFTLALPYQKSYIVLATTNNYKNSSQYVALISINIRSLSTFYPYTFASGGVNLQAHNIFWLAIGY